MCEIPFFIYNFVGVQNSALVPFEVEKTHAHIHDIDDGRSEAAEVPQGLVR